MSGWTVSQDSEGTGLTLASSRPPKLCGQEWFAVRLAVRVHPAAAEAGAWWSRKDQTHKGGYDVATTSEDGKVWFGGQRYFDTSSQSWVDTAYRGFAYDIAVDGRGGLWIGTDHGVYCIPDPVNSSQEEWQSFTTEDGLGGNSVRRLAIADDGAIWLGAENFTVTRCAFGQ